MPKGIYIRIKQRRDKGLNHKPMSENTRLVMAEKMKLSKNGKHYPKMSERQIGDKNPFWKGGVTSMNQLQRVKFQQTIQKEILERDNYTCQMCGTEGGILHVDHIQSWSEYVELRFSMDNCRTLCRDCHYLVTFGKTIPADSKWGTKNIYG